jgi:hypothetical protein
VDLTAAGGEIHAVERAHAGKGLAHVAKLEEWYALVHSE